MSDTNPKFDEYKLRVFRTYREKVSHEDNLVNQRVFWLVTFQALLFTSFALLTQGDFSAQAFRATTLVFALVGIGSATFTYFSVMAAFDAIQSTATKWTKLKATFDPNDVFPGLVGDGIDGGIHVRGKYTGWSLPLLVALAWIAIGLIVTFVWTPSSP